VKRTSFRRILNSNKLYLLPPAFEVSVVFYHHLSCPCRRCSAKKKIKRANEQGRRREDQGMSPSLQVSGLLLQVLLQVLL